jgi:hypothetical protein
LRKSIAPYYGTLNSRDFGKGRSAIFRLLGLTPLFPLAFVVTLVSPFARGQAAKRNSENEKPPVSIFLTQPRRRFLPCRRGKNPLVTFPRIPGHEVAATVVSGANQSLAAGVNVTMSPYTSCGNCVSCLRQRPNACQFNETLGVQRDGALTEYILMPADQLYVANLTIKELCLVEPLTVGFHAVARGRVTAEDSMHRKFKISR